MRPGYAVEYDFVPPTELKADFRDQARAERAVSRRADSAVRLAMKSRGQGLMAGINAALQVQRRRLWSSSALKGTLGCLLTTW